jgi:transcriptional regulator with XRE-family HTH domain
VRLDQISQEITEGRKRSELSQRQLAERAGVSRATVEALENGRAAEIGYTKLSRILAVLGLELRLGPAERDRPTLDDLLKEDSDHD